MKGLGHILSGICALLLLVIVVAGVLTVAVFGAALLLAALPVLLPIFLINLLIRVIFGLDEKVDWKVVKRELSRSGVKIDVKRK